MMHVINAMKPHPTMPNYPKPSQARMVEKIHRRLGKDWHKKAAKKGVVFNLHKFEHGRIKEQAKRHVSGLSIVKNSHKKRNEFVESRLKNFKRRSFPRNVRFLMSPKLMAKYYT
jgi:hypothetical protein